MHPYDTVIDDGPHPDTPEFRALIAEYETRLQQQRLALIGVEPHLERTGQSAPLRMTYKGPLDVSGGQTT